MHVFCRYRLDHFRGRNVISETLLTIFEHPNSVLKGVFFDTWMENVDDFDLQKFHQVLSLAQLCPKMEKIKIMLYVDEPEEEERPNSEWENMTSNMFVDNKILKLCCEKLALDLSFLLERVRELELEIT